MSTPNILLVIPNLGQGGAQRVFRDQLRFYAQHARVTACVFNRDNFLLSDQNLNIVSLNVPAGKNFLSKIYFLFQRVVRLKKMKKINQIDISISHLEGADYVNLLSRRDEKVVLWVHGTKKFDENIEGALGWTRRVIMIPSFYRRSDLIVAVSAALRIELIEFFGLPPKKVKTISNCISVADIQRLSERDNDLFLTGGRSATFLVTHCRLARQKNLNALIRIFGILVKDKPIKLVIVGDGELRNDLIDLCNTIHLSVYSPWGNSAITEDHDVYFVGHQENPYQFLSKASLYLLTSSWEGFPLSLCEAMACEIPVMASDCYTGPREILSCNEVSAEPIKEPYFSLAGVLMPLANSNENIQLWSRTVNFVLENEELRLKIAKGGVERAMDFDRKNIEKQWLEIISAQGK